MGPPSHCISQTHIHTTYRPERRETTGKPGNPGQYPQFPILSPPLRQYNSFPATNSLVPISDCPPFPCYGLRRKEIPCRTPAHPKPASNPLFTKRTHFSRQQIQNKKLTPSNHEPVAPTQSLRPGNVGNPDESVCDSGTFPKLRCVTPLSCAWPPPCTTPSRRRSLPNERSIYVLADHYQHRLGRGRPDLLRRRSHRRVSGDCRQTQESDCHVQTRPRGLRPRSEEH